jgi:regulator of sigma E protease
VLPEPLNSILAFALVLGVLIFVHEYGHYWAARRVGIRVEVFSVGFGRSIWQRTARDGTVWKVGWMPLGGYVKLHGQEAQADDQAEVQQQVESQERRRLPLPSDSFAAKPVWARAFVVAAGPVANFLLAAVLFVGLFAVAGQRVAAPVIGEVVPGMPAEAAGLVAGDRVVAIDGAPVVRFDEIQRLVRESGGRELGFTVRRDGAEREVRVAPARRDGALLLGIRGGATEVRELGPLQAVGAGFTETWRITAATFDALWGMITLSRSAEDLGGPIAIARMSGEVAQLGIAAMITFIAVLSVNLGLLNLLPIPILDGGHLVMFAAEAARGRPLPPRAVEYGFRAGAALLLMIFVAVTWKDLAGLGLFRWVTGLFG